MATTTTNYGFDIPQSTDLVKDGATAIATLGQDIDTAMNTALGTKKAGMVLLNTTSFSAVSSQVVSNVFSANYKSYKIVTELSFSAAQDCYMRLRVGGTSATGANYQFSHIRGFSTTLQTNSASGETGWQMFYYSSIGAAWNEMILHNTFEAAPSYYTSTWRTNQPAIGLLAGTHSLSTSYDSFEIYATGGTLTGSIKTYGLNQ